MTKPMEEKCKHEWVEEHYTKYRCLHCGHSNQDERPTASKIENKGIPKEVYDQGYEAMIKYCADNQLDIAIPSCVKVL